MSECIVRMEMPINCLECPMYDWNRQKLCCNAHFDLRPIPNGGVPKPDWCYVICSLPEGHGRLVDAEELKRNHMFYHEADNRSYAEERDIDETLTIVPAEAERSET